MRSELDVGELSVKKYVDVVEARRKDAEMRSEPDVGDVDGTTPASHLEAVVDSQMRSEPERRRASGKYKRRQHSK